ncbi:MAG: hypothetical protein IKW85_04840 [Muribaculaceae bacterium]|nr:hypothetical protein [Muribaculaceae bacterium]
MEKIDKNMGEILGEIGCRFRGIIESHIKDYRLQKGNDVEWLLEPLDLISHPSDLALDTFRCGFGRDWAYELYFHYTNAKSFYQPYNLAPDSPILAIINDGSIIVYDDIDMPESNPYDKSMLIQDKLDIWSGHAIPSVWDDVMVPFTELGIWQAQLLHRALTFMPKGWHGNYLNHWYVFSQDDMQRIFDKYSSYKSVDHEMLESYLGRDDILPSVNIDGDKAVVTYCIWTRWGGLCRLTVPVERHNQSVIFGESERQTLVKYHCGWVY